jgi:glycosyltransferase involved in cell wall biosynthesis
VRFYGAIYDEAQLAPLFLRACAVVSPGKIGLLAMHAMAYGSPIITHNDFERQMPEVEAINPGQTGAFFSYGEVPDLASKMSMFLELSPETRAKYHAAAIARIEERYTPEAQVAYIIEALDKTITRDH